MYAMGTALNGEMLRNLLAAAGDNASLKPSDKVMAVLLMAMAALPQIAITWSMVRRIRSRGASPVKPYSNDILAKKTSAERKRTFFIILLTMIYLLLVFRGLFAPLANAVTTLVAYFRTSAIEFEPDFTTADSLFQRSSGKARSNLVFILNESMGSFYFKDKDNKAVNSPFYTEHIESSKDKLDSPYFDALYARAVSGNTDTATPGALTGLIIANAPVSEATKNFFNVPTLVNLAKKHGYKTAAYVSYDTYYETAWKHLTKIFEPFDEVISKTTLNGESVNDLGMDDRIIATRALRYIRNRAQDEPFFLLIIWNNLHQPFFVTEEFEESLDADDDEIEVQRAQFSVKLTDEMMTSMMGGLYNGKILDDTLVVFAADHGEMPGKERDRISYPTSSVLAVPLWFHVPKALLSNEERKIFKTNVKDRLLTNLDIVPTVVDLLGWMDNVDQMFNMSRATKHGQSLLKPVPEDRILVGWQGRPFVQTCSWNTAYFSNSTHTVFLRPSDTIEIEHIERPNNAYILEKISWSDLSEEEREYWKGIFFKKGQDVLEQMRFCGMTII
jgi:hypothetical protein